MQHLQRVQNILCRIVTRTHRFSSITGPLMSFHRLPVKSRVQFKLGLITYKVYKNKYPAYLETYVQPYRSIYHTRRSKPARHMLSIPHYNYKQHKSFTHLSKFFSVQLQNCGTHFLRLVDVHLHWVRIVLCSRHISEAKSIPAIAFCHVNTDRGTEVPGLLSRTTLSTNVPYPTSPSIYVRLRMIVARFECRLDLLIQKSSASPPKLSYCCLTNVYIYEQQQLTMNRTNSYIFM